MACGWQAFTRWVLSIHKTVSVFCNNTLYRSKNLYSSSKFELKQIAATSFLTLVLWLKIYSLPSNLVLCCFPLGFYLGDAVILARFFCSFVLHPVCLASLFVIPCVFFCLCLLSLWPDVIKEIHSCWSTQERLKKHKPSVVISSLPLPMLLLMSEDLLLTLFTVFVQCDDNTVVLTNLIWSPIRKSGDKPHWAQWHLLLGNYAAKPAVQSTWTEIWPLNTMGLFLCTVCVHVQDKVIILPSSLYYLEVCSIKCNRIQFSRQQY